MIKISDAIKIGTDEIDFQFAYYQIGGLVLCIIIFFRLSSTLLVKIYSLCYDTVYRQTSTELWFYYGDERTEPLSRRDRYTYG